MKSSLAMADFFFDSDDAGGATKLGVTIGTLKRLGMGLTGDGRATRADVRVLNKEQE